MTQPNKETWNVLKFPLHALIIVETVQQCLFATENCFWTIFGVQALSSSRNYWKPFHPLCRHAKIRYRSVVNTHITKTFLRLCKCQELYMHSCTHCLLVIFIFKINNLIVTTRLDYQHYLREVLKKIGKYSTKKK